MPDFDITKPSPDRGHEAIRVAVVAAVADLGQNIADTEDGLYLTDVVFELLDAVLAAVDDHAARLTALENPPPPEGAPVAN